MDGLPVFIGFFDIFRGSKNLFKPPLLNQGLSLYDLKTNPGFGCRIRVLFLKRVLHHHKGTLLIVSTLRDLGLQQESFCIGIPIVIGAILKIFRIESLARPYDSRNIPNVINPNGAQQPDNRKKEQAVGPLILHEKISGFKAQLLTEAISTPMNQKVGQVG